MINEHTCSTGDLKFSEIDKLIESSDFLKITLARCSADHHTGVGILGKGNLGEKKMMQRYDNICIRTNPLINIPDRVLKDTLHTDDLFISSRFNNVRQQR